MKSSIIRAEANQPELQKLKRYTQLVYALQAIGIFIPFLYLLGLGLNAMHMSRVQDSALLRSHFRWQIRTFWFGLLWVLLGWMLLAIYVGLLVLLANLVWVIYRVLKGWLNLDKEQPMYQ